MQSLPALNQTKLRVVEFPFENFFFFFFLVWGAQDEEAFGLMCWLLLKTPRVWFYLSHGIKWKKLKCYWSNDGSVKKKREKLGLQAPIS